GKNLAQKIAQRSGAPSALIFRRLGFESSYIKIKLDQAVFRAGQDGQAVVFGDTSAQTIAALMEWQLQGGPNGAVIAPLSAVFDMSE
ncbi:MAG: divergent polysaccharide deacetylase family protein, partial [Paracoccaceae bacterium]|nr:divergent polysaccharide deacetylase family protein [Paracoccaceae bacterium]